MADLKALAEQLVNLSVKEVKELADILKEDYGIEPVAAGPVVVASGEAGGEESAQEQTEFDVVLLSIGNNRMKVYKALKEITGLGLKEAKALADKAPDAVIKEKVSKAEAEEVKEKLEAIGATVEVR